MHMTNIHDLKTAAHDRVRLLEHDIPLELKVAYETLHRTATADLGVSLADVDPWLAVWMTEYMSALGGIPSIIIRRDGADGVDLVRMMLLRGATGAFS